MNDCTRKILNLLLFTAVAAVPATAVQAADGQTLYSQKGCVACHGNAGKEPIMPNYPMLAGQNKAYLIEQMKDIKSGARDNGQASVMKPMIANVTEDEIKAIAEYLSGQ